jgi:hypothetical protein
MNDKYQYYSILEINYGKIQTRKNAFPFSSKKLRESQYKIANSICYSKSILDSSLLDKIGLINLSDCINLDVNKLRHPIKFPPINLIIALYDEEIIANELPIPDNYGNLIENSEYFKRNEHFASSLAIKHYLEDNNPKYLKDSNKLQSIILEINNNHFNNIKFLNPLLDAPNFSSTLLHKQNRTPLIEQYIDECITNNNEIQKFYLTSIGLYREYDLYENRGLQEYESGNGYYDIFSNSEKWEIPNKSETKFKWKNETNKWDETLINSLKLISEKYNKEINLKVSYDYPIINSFYNYHLL